MSSKWRFYCPSQDMYYPNFPPFEHALDEEEFNGLLCFSNYDSLDANLLIEAYEKGIFPWSEENEQNSVVWFAPPQRPVFDVTRWHPSRSMRKTIKSYEKRTISCSVNQQFQAVLEGCAERENTWITPQLKTALVDLHQRGLGYSFEVYSSEKRTLIGGLYGIAMYPIFFAESMFSLQSGASKYAFYQMMCYLKQQGYTLVDAQVHSEHLDLLGCQMISRAKLQSFLNKR